MAKRPPRKPPRHVTLPRGFRAAGGTCGIKASGNPDLTLIVADRPCAAAGVFTTNQVPSAPVLIDRKHLRRTKGMARAIVCNSGNANASTGKLGLDNAIAMCRLVASQIACDPHEVLPSSTGIIGRQLPMEKIRAGIETLASRLDRGPQADAAAARGIMTTDLVPKSALGSFALGGKRVHLAGICKGSGMIAPNMATMLAFVTTDAAIAPAALLAALRSATAASFNRISVDQHTSPSDTVIALASGRAGHAPIAAPRGRDYQAFADALTELCRDLAYQIVRDGEGATKVFRVRVTGAASAKAADRVAQAIVNSPLVKTAVHGGDPNWGRITTAAGYAGVRLKPDRMSLAVGPIRVFDKGQPTTLRKAQQRQLVRIMKAKEIAFKLELGQGSAQVEWLGCDLSRQYIAINADYTT